MDYELKYNEENSLFLDKNSRSTIKTIFKLPQLTVFFVTLHPQRQQKNIYSSFLGSLVNSKKENDNSF